MSKYSCGLRTATLAGAGLHKRQHSCFLFGTHLRGVPYAPRLVDGFLNMNMHSNNAGQARLRIGIVGCGKVAEHHARFIKVLNTAQFIAVADVNEEAARRFAETHEIPHIHTTIDDLLDSTELDVLHVITPPAYHYECAKAALDRGIHVFVEKPVVFTVREVTDLYDRAAARGVLLCPDFLQLFHPKVQELLALINSEQLGRVIHVESYLCLNPDDSPELLETEGIYWSYRMPGGPLRNYTSHLLSLALCFAGLPNDIHVSRSSRGTLPQGLVDHLVVHMNGTRSTATVLLSYLARPSAYGLRVPPLGPAAPAAVTRPCGARRADRR